MNLSMTQQLILISPVLLLTAASLFLLLVDCFLPKVATVDGPECNTEKSPGWVEISTVMFVIVALVAALLSAGSYRLGSTLFHGLLFGDGLSWLYTYALLAGSLIALFLGMRSIEFEGVSAKAEFYSLYLMCIVGVIVFCTAAELITLFIGLEIMSMALYCLCGAVVPNKGPIKSALTALVRRSSESALKYFLLGSFSSAFLLYGIALIYGLTGSTKLSVIAAQAGHADPILLSLALGLILVGLAFKIGAAPFHFWAPDVYQGAPTSITAFMACIIKAAAVVVALRLFGVTFIGQFAFWSPAIWILAVLSMTVGNVLALRQRRSIKRLLAYSSISHAGYLLAGFMGLQAGAVSSAAIVFYLISYTVMTLGAFGVTIAISSRNNAAEESDDMNLLNGLGTRNPALAILMTLFMLSLAGIPPGMAGFVGKFLIFSSAVKAGYVGLVIIGVLNSAISCYYYLYVVVRMFFSEVDPKQAQPEILEGFVLRACLWFCAACVIVFGLLPEGIFNSLSSVLGI